MSDVNQSPVTDNEPSNSDSVGFDAEKVQGLLFKNRMKGNSRKKKITGIVIVLIVLLAAGYGYKKWSASNSSIDYTTATVTKGTVTDYVEATGTLSAIKQSQMGFKNDDTITAINVQVGDEVKKGQVLAEQDASSLQVALQQAENTVAQDEISLKSAMLTHEANRKTMERQQKLYDAGALSESDLDTAKDNYAKSELEVANSKIKLSADQSKVSQAQEDLSACTLVAPFDGIIGEVNGQVGQINGINSSSSTLLTVLSKDLELTALVNEADIGRIKVGQDVEFSSSSYSNKTFKGKVERITPQAETVSNVQYYSVLISCSDSGGQLLSGMSVTAKIIVSQSKDVLTIPMMAVSFAQTYLQNNPTALSNNTGNSVKKNTGSNSKPAQPPASQTQTTSGADQSGGTNNKTMQKSFVVVMKNKQISVKNVVLGLSDGSNYEVKSGLSEGEQIVVGSTQLDTESSSSSNSKSSSSKQNQRGGMGMGGPPGM